MVCGLSMGGYVAFELFQRYPERVRGLIFINSRAEADGPQAQDARNEMIRTVEEEGVSAIADLLVPKLLAPESISTMPQVAERVHAMIKSAPAWSAPSRPCAIVRTRRICSRRLRCRRWWWPGGRTS